MDTNQPLVCCKCGNHFDATYEYEGKVYCRRCLKNFLGVEETIEISYHYPDNLEMCESDLDDIFMEYGVNRIFDDSRFTVIKDADSERIAEYICRPESGKESEMTKENVVTKKEEVEELEEDEAQQQGGEVNKVVCKGLFLSATKSSKGSIGVAILLHDGIDEKGQVRVTLEAKKSGNVNYTLSPVIQTWFSSDAKKTDPAVYKQAEELLTRGGLSDIYPIVSGVGDFRKIHRFLSKQDYEMYLNLIK